MRFARIYGLTLMLSLMSYWANATHIMGGELNYTYVSEGTYKFTLVYYVDCVNGSSAAIASDEFAIFGFFNARTKDFIETREIQRDPPVRISKLNYSCVTQPPNACVDRYEYTFTMNIDPGKDGLIVSFQRCCRNHTITNLVDPGGTGMTLFAVIPPTDDIEVNSNPVFKDSPPNFLCNDAPLVFDHSAVDPDGDSLVYDLYLPFKGATASIPRPSQPSNPDYSEVQYTSAFNLSDLMGGVEKLKIDRKTGLLTVWPSKIGQYVVGIRVNEYRDGKKIGETLRDYQFNVLHCVFGVKAGFQFPSINCSDSTVQFTNSSESALTYIWKIEDAVGSLPEMDEPEPLVKFPRKGKYDVTLIAVNKDCSDSTTKTIEIGHQDSIQASFTVTPKVACEGANFSFNNTSDVTPDWFWNTDQGRGEEHNLELNDLVYTEPGTYQITLRIIDSTNCLSEKVVQEEIEVLEHIDQQADFEVEFPDPCNPGYLVLTKTDTISDPWTWDIAGHSADYKNKSRVELNGLASGFLSISLQPSEAKRMCTENHEKTESVKVSELENLISELTLFNIFTPNDDGLNDCFTLAGDGLECFDVSVVIYSRWGEIVFSTDEGTTTCWDGTNGAGRQYPEGTYFGIINIKQEMLDYEEDISIGVTLTR